ncbi:DUF2470 domain-containing protein [Skermania piniformis]|uniref:DUF2470 domain-containing protein n=1 Tax=Skermania pinensis TaxID=39122 RepID=A0ABX8SEA2_9ACTN|nr:DUF2470 domain-containing protein [Skermania piniformis]QXQ14011.1 DUF2470 domain-containing protein [Skermania piniformis]
MPYSTHAPGPSVAERIRTAATSDTDAMLVVPGADPVPVALHHLRPDCTLVIAIANDSPAVEYARFGGGDSAVVEITDRAPLPLREPVRSLVWLRGTVRAVPWDLQQPTAVAVAAECPAGALLDVGHRTTLLQLTVRSAVLADSTGAESVGVAELRDAPADPFRPMEAEWLRHLAAEHPDVIMRIARRLPAARRGTVYPLAVDRYGLSLRIEGRGGKDSDARLPFPAPVDDIAGLSRAVRALIGCPFRNGARAW